ncbi:MAG: iron-sulfur cluster-binding protein [Alphaproteobacteria bacterium]|nr:iron-sulfur cluster-binding protein [Alphaproteobacteria bacterium]
MQIAAPAFKEQAARALADPHLQEALGLLESNFGANRQRAIERLPEFDALRDEARAIKDHVLANLDFYLERFADNVERAGGAVHWCASPEEARATILTLCQSVGARSVTKGKSMVGEEIGLNEFLLAAGIEPVETDLGEYIIQLAGETPSHIVAPAVHKTKDQVADLFFAQHRKYGKTRRLDEAPEIVAEGRAVLRQRYLDADVGITGANFLIAETGSTVIVTNEGNGDLTQLLPRMHIVLAGIEKVVPNLEDMASILRVLARSATGQEFSAYVTISTGPRRVEDSDGPAAYHVILIDNGRSALLGGPLREVLRCIRCGACLNHCPVYGAIGGHAYGWVYSGPIGAVLTPGLIGIEAGRHLPNASSFCGRCEEVCPVRIPLPKLMRHWREQAFARALNDPAERWALRLWAFLARRPALYRLATALAARLLAWAAGGSGRLQRLPFARAWTAGRDLPAPEGRTFQALWRARRRT